MSARHTPGKVCTICGKPSIRGLKAGKCQYHWNAGVWGKDHANQVELRNAIEAAGYNWDDCPYTPIDPKWEDFPIVKAIRAAERSSGAIYHRPMDPPKENI